MDDNWIKSREEIANKIMTLGPGGKSIKTILDREIAELSNDCAVIDIGPLMGSTTAYMGIAIKKYDKTGIEFHCYDKWEWPELYVRKAMRKNKNVPPEGTDILPIFLKNLEDFELNIKSYRGNFKTAPKYEGPRIGLVVDDICSGKRMTEKMFNMFLPDLIPGSTIIMLDYWYHKTPSHKHNSGMFYQRNLIEANPQSFVQIGRIGAISPQSDGTINGESMAHAVKYTGVFPNYLDRLLIPDTDNDLYWG